MRQIEIPDNVLDKLAEALIQIFGGKKGYSSQVIMHIKSTRTDKAMSWIADTKESCSHSLGDYNVLIEFSEGPILFVNHGSSAMNKHLIKQFGGCITSKCWVLYKPESVLARNLPTAKDIIDYIE